MKQILCFGDSNTYGYIPKTGKRYDWGVRWTSILNEELGLDSYRVIEEGLCGRTTIFEDPLRDGRRGTGLLPVLLETHGHPDIIVVMLGTNDCKAVYGATPEIIGKGISKIINQIHTYSKKSRILLISPIHLGERVWEEGYDTEFSKSSVETSKGLADVYKKISKREDVYYLDASRYSKPSEADQEHMDETGHKALAFAVLSKIREIEAA
ncbi:MAG: arylesterase [Lachnospiraceae bacterium]|nr:arylesterase [Lachnospiraceae bacterium]